MAEQTYRSPGFFEREIDLSQQETPAVGTPAGIIGTAAKGPAFIPVTVGSIADFEARFGSLDPNRFGPYAVNEYLKNKDAVTYMRVLGAGSNDTDSEIQSTLSYGTVSKAGFKVKSTTSARLESYGGNYDGAVQFLVAKHYISASGELTAFPEFTDNDSFSGAEGGSKLNILRGVLFCTTASRGIVMTMTSSVTEGSIWTADNYTTGDFAGNVQAGTTNSTFSDFKFIISCSAGNTFAHDDDVAGARVYTASLDPSRQTYIGKVLNTDPLKFEEEQHLLYLDFAVEDEVAAIWDGSTTGDAGRQRRNTIALLSGSATTNSLGGQSEAWRDSFGRYDTRYQTPRSPSIISQPYGDKEYDLFHFEALSDGAWGNSQLKVSIANLRASTDPNNKFGTFEVQVRKFSDTDTQKEVLETYPDLTLDPAGDRYIGKQIGDKKVKFDFDATDTDERRLVISGLYPNKSVYVRVVLSKALRDGDVPTDALPFGFRGVPVVKSSDTLTNTVAALKVDGKTYGSTSTARLSTVKSGGFQYGIVPPLPFRFKLTKGKRPTSVAFVGAPGPEERVDGNLYWGTKYERVPLTGSTTDAILNPNSSQLPNPVIKAYAAFQSLAKLDNLVTGSGADAFNNNKFTLARVALYNQLQSGHISHITGSGREHILEAAYIRNGNPDNTNYTVSDGDRSDRITFATLVNSSSVKFNRFTEYAKFTAPFYGGFDGLNNLDEDIYYMNDRGSSTDSGGKAADSITGGLGLYGTNDGTLMGKGKQNNTVFSYRTAIEIMTDPMTVNTNLLAVPSIRDPFITDLAADRTKAYSMAMYVMDIQQYDEDENRLFADSTTKTDVRETAEQFESRRVNNNYCATYFPDVFITDETNNRSVEVPSSVAVLGALGYNDTVAYPWFAPAGFNRGGLDFVTNTEVRLTSADRDTLYDARINPIANFPNGGFVIFGQKTLQLTKSALDRVNVRRMLLEIKRLIVQVAEKLLFEPNTPDTRSRFIGQVGPILALVQAQQGIEKFTIIMDDTNNTTEDVELNKLNGRIIVVPTRSIEFIAMDFIITNSGVSFE